MHTRTGPQAAAPARRTRGAHAHAHTTTRVHVPHTHTQWPKRGHEQTHAHTHTHTPRYPPRPARPSQIRRSKLNPEPSLENAGPTRAPQHWHGGHRALGPGPRAHHRRASARGPRRVDLYRRSCCPRRGTRASAPHAWRSQPAGPARQTEATSGHPTGCRSGSAAQSSRLAPSVHTCCVGQWLLATPLKMRHLQGPDISGARPPVALRPTARRARQAVERPDQDSSPPVGHGGGHHARRPALRDTTLVAQGPEARLSLRAGRGRPQVVAGPPIRRCLAPLLARQHVPRSMSQAGREACARMLFGEGASAGGRQGPRRSATRRAGMSLDSGCRAPGRPQASHADSVEKGEGSGEGR